MPFGKYRTYSPVDLPSRTWPFHVIGEAPQWCPVDLRDGNQALAVPMDSARKERLFDLQVRMGYKEIEVGFPAASQTDYDFVRRLIEEDLIPDDVTIQVITPAREELIRRTYDSLRGARCAIVHLYNSTSCLQREVVFGMDRAQIKELAVRGTRLCSDLAERLPDTHIRYEYTSESFTGTELDFALDICDAVAEVWQPTPENRMILNLPATVEMSTPNIYADQIEWMHRNLSRRDALILSVHPHNDRGTAVAATELALLAGAERVEGCLFGNGERSGNVDLVTLGLNLHTQGIDPMVDLSDIPTLVSTVEDCTGIPVHPRHPYAGELVHTAFSGSHQDAIKKGYEALAREQREALEAGETGAVREVPWAVPYLPIDPEDIGRDYTAVIRVNSQSGKGGVAYVLRTKYQLELERGIQVEFAQAVQEATDTDGGEISAEVIWKLFRRQYLDVCSPLEVSEFLVAPSVDDGIRHLTCRALVLGRPVEFKGSGADLVAALLDALDTAGYTGLSLGSVTHHPLAPARDTEGGGTGFGAYASVCRGDRVVWGAALDPDPAHASLRAVVCAVNRLSAMD
ncbi:2-isopropylmalate synthase [Streptomyces sp. NPDC088554]|uniref:2-isopropylmalate synthase n=1 Tax=Streptomyces sp. NPDC088554 TaxID=3365865 RepID=UPI003819D9B2